MLTLDKPSENLGDAGWVAYIMSNNLNKFPKIMTPCMLTKREALAGETLTACGYMLELPPPPTKLSAYEMRIAQLRDGWESGALWNGKAQFLGSVEILFVLFPNNPQNLSHGI